MADEDAFDFSAVEEIPPEEGAEAPAEGAAEGAPVERVLAEGEGKYDHYEKVALPQYTLHWVRPLILGYRYNYDYRQNYYNDVIDWMNKRQKGLYREEPRAQEWSERALRTYKMNNANPSVKRTADMGIITKMPHKPRHYSYHTRAYYSLKYQKIL